jgi:hypothetical protein
VETRKQRVCASVFQVLLKLMLSYGKGRIPSSNQQVGRGMGGPFARWRVVPGAGHDQFEMQY